MFGLKFNFKVNIWAQTQKRKTNPMVSVKIWSVKPKYTHLKLNDMQKKKKKKKSFEVMSKGQYCKVYRVIEKKMVFGAYRTTQPDQSAHTRSQIRAFAVR